MESAELSANPVLALWTGPHGGAPAFDRIETLHFVPALEAAGPRGVDCVGKGDILCSAADVLTDPENPGCLAVQGALSCGNAAETIKQELMDRRARGEDDLRLRFERAIVEGDLPASADAADLARYVSTILQGMAVQAAGGVDRDKLRRLANLAMRNWPPV